jgi:hypothetical protein
MLGNTVSVHQPYDERFTLKSIGETWLITWEEGGKFDHGY